MGREGEWAKGSRASAIEKVRFGEGNEIRGAASPAESMTKGASPGSSTRPRSNDFEKNSAFACKTLIESAYFHSLGFILLGKCSLPDLGGHELDEALRVLRALQGGRGRRARTAACRGGEHIHT